MISKEGDNNRPLTMQRKNELMIDEKDENHQENAENIDGIEDETNEGIEETSE
jgi:hypothetical protein